MQEQGVLGAADSSEVIQIEWVESGWPLRPDGTSDSSAANDLCRFAVSSGLQQLTKDDLGRFFNEWGGPWSPLGDAPGLFESWPPEFPGGLVLKAEPALERLVGRGLVLALVERRNKPRGGAFRRCVWFVLPSSWSTDLDPVRIGMVATRLLEHRGAMPVDGRYAAPLTMPFGVPKEGELVPARLIPVDEGQGIYRSAEPCTPVTVLMGLIDHMLDDVRATGGTLSPRLARGVASLCAPAAATTFAYAVAVDQAQLHPAWIHPLPLPGSQGGVRAAVPGPPTPLRVPGPIVDERALDLERPRAPAVLQPTRERPESKKLLRMRFLEWLTLPRLLVLLQLLQVVLLIVVITRQSGPLNLEAPRDAEPALPTATRVAPSEPRSVLLANVSGQPGHGFLLPAAALPLSASQFQSHDLALLGALGGKGGPLSVLGFSGNTRCSAADVAARVRAEEVRAALPEELRPEEVIVVGNRRSPAPDILAGSPLQDSVLLIRPAQATEWASVAEIPCEY